ncbi:MAG: hypothetical protein HY908_04000 [Myxococcales bacterium]|nr:hypothetical protein [Myxococcales bacterium]
MPLEAELLGAALLEVALLEAVLLPEGALLEAAGEVAGPGASSSAGFGVHAERGPRTKGSNTRRFFMSWVREVEASRAARAARG